QQGSRGDLAPTGTRAGDGLHGGRSSKARNQPDESPARDQSNGYRDPGSEEQTQDRNHDGIASDPSQARRGWSKAGYGPEASQRGASVRLPSLCPGKRQPAP